MKISIISSGGTLRGLYLAEQLDRKGFLSRLYIPFYSRKHPFIEKRLITRNHEHRIDPRKVTTDIPVSMAQKYFFGSKLSGAIKKNDKRYMIYELIDKRNAGAFKADCDILFVESYIALHTIMAARKEGVRCVLDRTNTHVKYQSAVISEEYVKYGINMELNSSAIIEKGIKEYELADRIAVLSNFVRKTFLDKNINEEKLLTIPSGVSAEKFKKSGKKDNIFRVVFCGRASIKKGTHYLLEAFSGLSIPGAELWLIGGYSGEMLPFFKKYEGTFKMFGHIDHNKLGEYYSQASVFVLPSIEEGLAKVMMEAMACGIPVIATPNTGAEDVIRNGIDGFIVPAGSADALKEKIVYYYENPSECIGMGESARMRILSGFTWEHYAERFIEGMKGVSA
ncbi:MAG: glycosyltransferase family 4 protein [Candidatus Omnitrophica bacterium]|nr:glycosyltransferase family 4 protein [Candidatus Omnitrophota bacterium]